MNLYRAVQGDIWKKVDLQEWKEKQYIAYFECVERFLRERDGEKKIIVSTEDLMKLEQDAFSGQYPFLQELVTRINQLTTDPKATPHKFFLKFNAQMRIVGGYLKEHPSIVTEKMRELILRNPRMAWCLVHFEVTETKVGIPMVTETALDNVKPGSREVAPSPNTDIQMSESRMYLADAMHTLTKSLTKKELQKMTPKDKLTAAMGIMKVLQQAQGYKPNIGVLNQLVINKANRDDLESAILDMK